MRRHTGIWPVLLGLTVVTGTTLALAQDAPEPKAEPSGSSVPAKPETSPDEKTSPADSASGTPAPEAPKTEAAPKDSAAPSVAEKPESSKKTEAPADTNSVLIHIDSPATVRLAHREPGAGEWIEVCYSPCDKTGSLEDEYVVVGEGMRASKPFRLQPGASRSASDTTIKVESSASRVVLRVRPGYETEYKRGMYVLGAGGALVVGGIVYLVASLVGREVVEDDHQTMPNHTGTIALGSTVILAGLVGGITGGAWMQNNVRTRVRGDVAGMRGSNEPNTRPQTSVTISHALSAPAFVFPVLSGTF